MHAVVQQDAVVYGPFLDAHAKYFLKYGVLAETEVEHVAVIDVITIQVPAEDHITLK